jgi:hypothetical protein
LSNLEAGVRTIIRVAPGVQVLSAQDAGIPTLLQVVNVAPRGYSIAVSHINFFVALFKGLLVNQDFAFLSLRFACTIHEPSWVYVFVSVCRHFASLKLIMVFSESCLHTLRYSTVVYCTVLYCTELYCTVLYCTVLHCTVPYCTVMHCTVPYCAVLYCTVLHCTVAYYTVLTVL